MFLALLSFDDFIAEATRENVPAVYVQTTMREDRHGGIRAGLRSYVTLTALGLAAGQNTPILVARIHVESVELAGPDDREREIAVGRRAEQAHALLSEALAARTGARIAPGLLLQNGMLEEINKIETSHRLWTWKNGRDPIAREIEYLDRPL
jgi:hypothetical protein